LRIEASNNAGNSIYRQADLTGATSATLNFSYNNQYDGGTKHVVVEVSGNGGSSWTILASFHQNVDLGPGTRSYDISSFMSSDTQIRIRIVTASPSSRYMYFDNIEIDYQTTVAPTGGSTAFSTATDTAQLSVNAVNDAPQFNNLGGSVNFTEGGPAVVLDNNVEIFDVELSDANNFSGATLTLARNGGANAEDIFSATGTLSLTGGNVIVGATTIGTFTQTGGTLELTFNANATNVLVNSAMQQIAYSNSNQNPPANVQIDWTFNDGNSGSQGIGGALTATGNVIVNITPVNDEQVLAVNTGITVQENAIGSTIDQTMLETTDVDNTPAELVYTVTAGPSHGTLRRSGVALGVNDTFTQQDINNGLITYDHDGSENHSDSFSFSVDDGEGAASTGTFNIAITPVNDNAPVITSDGGGATANVNVAENSTFVTFVTATDADQPGDTLTFSITGGADAGHFTIDANTGELSFVSAPDFENPTDSDLDGVYVVTVAVFDGVHTTSQTISVTITDVNEFAIGPISDTNPDPDFVLENSALGTTVGIVAFADDPDGTDTVSYSLDDDAGGLFAIDATTGVVTVAGAIDRETVGATLDITVRATSTDGSFSTQLFTIAIGDVDEFDVGPVTDSNGATNEVAEDAVIGTAVGITAFAEDLDATDTVTYSLDDDAGGLFAIDANSGVVTVAGALDYETATSHNITVRATSTDGSFSTQVFTINVLDVNEFAVGPISDTDTDPNFVMENSSIGTAVGIIAFADDPDGTDTVSYSLDDDAGGLFAIDATTGVVTVAGALDYETATSHNITVRATSTDGSFSTAMLTINIIDVNEFAVGPISDTNPDPDFVLENSAVGTTVGIIAFADDPDGTDAVSYTLDDDAGGLFAIDALTGVVTVAGAIDREVVGATLDITVRATSTDSSFSTRVFTIAIGDVDEFDAGPISDTNIAANTVAEDAPIGTPVGITAFAEDLDATNNQITYTLDNDSGGLFAIDPVTGVVTVAATLDYETATSHNITVRATSQDGSFSTQDFTINVTDVNEYNVSVPVDINPDVNQVDEMALNGTLVGITAYAFDADGTNNGVAYSLVDDAGGRFSIDPQTGEVRVANGSLLDFEVQSQHQITIRATSEDGSISDASFTIFLNDVNDEEVLVNNQPLHLDQGTNSIIDSSLLLTTDQDHAPADLQYTVLTQPVHGQLLLNGMPTTQFTQADIDAGWVSYQHDGSLTIQDQFEFTVDDGLGSSTQGWFELVITITNFPPQGINDTYTMTAGSTLLATTSVLANDTDPNSDPLTAQIVTQPQHGSLQFNSDGTFVYQPAPGFFGVDQFTYRPHDGLQFGNDTTVVINVEAFVLAPISGANEGQTISSGNSTPSQEIDERSDNSETTRSATIGFGRIMKGGESTDDAQARQVSNRRISVSLTGDHFAERSAKDNELREHAESILRHLAIHGNRVKHNDEYSNFESLTETELQEEKAINNLIKSISELSEPTSVDLNSLELQFTVAATFGTLGYLLWSLRGGVLLAATMSQSPVWRFIDPLPVLDQYVTQKHERSQDTLDEIFDK
jgi:hypothetical protein